MSFTPTPEAKQKVADAVRELKEATYPSQWEVADTAIAAFVEAEGQTMEEDFKTGGGPWERIRGPWRKRDS